MGKGRGSGRQYYGSYGYHVAYAAGRQADCIEAAGERGFARAVVTQYRDEFAALNAEIHALENLNRLLTFFDRVGVLKILSLDNFSHFCIIHPLCYSSAIKRADEPQVC